MFADVGRWVGACIKCRVHKDNQPKSSGLLVPIKSAYPFQILCVDIKGPIKISKNGYKYILVCVDHFTSWVETAPLKSITAKEVIEVFFKMFISRHGCPEIYTKKYD